MLPRNQRMELLSKAYVRAVAAQAGFACIEVNPDFGIDFSIRAVLAAGNRFIDAGPLLEVQVKSATTAAVRVSEDRIAYDLLARSYELLRSNTDIQRVLVLFLMPEDEAEWLTQNETGLTLRNCCYCLSLTELPATANRSKVTVAIPRSNRFDASYLQRLASERKVL
jgi:hypothetical protein